MINRLIYEDLKTHLAQPEITVLIGPRQVGKTYLMKMLQEYLIKKGKSAVFVNLDIEHDRRLLTSQRTLIDYIRLQVGDKRAYVFIDEIQRKENAGLFLKGIYDMSLPYKFVVSGSGSLDLKAKIKESMAGRKQLFVIEPISFEEFVNFKTAYKYEDRLQDFFVQEEEKTQSLLDEYMMFGGYPKVVTAATGKEKKTVMDEIYQSYIERDITNLLGVEKSYAFSNLLKIMASQIGSLTNVSELASTVGLSTKTIQTYLWYLEETFILKKVTPFFRNTRSEITKSPVYYFYDIGIRNYILNLFDISSIPPSSSGHLFENFIFNILRLHLRSGPAAIHFWRTRDNAEVDFVINYGLETIPIEAKYKTLKKPEITRSFRSFLLKHKPAYGYIVHLGQQQDQIFEDSKIYFPPYFKLPKFIRRLSN